MSIIINQYKSIKAKYPDAILLFRVGDFYESFNADAETGSKILGLELNNSDNNEGIFYSAFFPHHLLNSHLGKW